MRSDRRVDALRKRIARDGLDALAVTNPANITYLTGFDGVFDSEEAHVALVDEGRALLITDGRYLESAEAAARGTEWEVTLAGAGLADALAAAIKGRHRIGFEDVLSLASHKTLSEHLEVESVVTRGLVNELRLVKEPEEIERIAAAQAITDAAFMHLLEFVTVGMTERAIALELEFFMRREGSEGIAFDPIVASGPNSARPHARVTDRKLARGDFLKLDFGARVGGYCADMTRTLVMGPASDQQQALYEAVAAANVAGIAAMRSGRTGRDVDAAARLVLDERGYGSLFTHGLGHGVGLEVHEGPGLGQRSEALLPSGAVVTIEPGIYLPEYGGVRIEDLVVVEDEGCRVLTRSPKALFEL